MHFSFGGLADGAFLVSTKLTIKQKIDSLLKILKKIILNYQKTSVIVDKILPDAAGNEHAL